MDSCSVVITVREATPPILSTTDLLHGTVGTGAEVTELPLGQEVVVVGAVRFCHQDMFLVLHYLQEHHGL